MSPSSKAARALASSAALSTAGCRELAALLSTEAAALFLPFFEPPLPGDLELLPPDSTAPSMLLSACCTSSTHISPLVARRTIDSTSLPVLTISLGPSRPATSKSFVTRCSRSIRIAGGLLRRRPSMTSTLHTAFARSENPQARVALNTCPSGCSTTSICTWPASLSASESLSPTGISSSAGGSTGAGTVARDPVAAALGPRRGLGITRFLCTAIPATSTSALARSEASALRI